MAARRRLRSGLITLTTAAIFALTLGCGGSSTGPKTSGNPLSSAVTRMTAVCGDGRVDPPETCDDANVNSGDGCSPSCVKET